MSSQESLGTVASGYQEDGFSHMMRVGEMGAVASATSTELATAPTTSVPERPSPQIAGGDGAEERGGEGARKKGETRMRPKEQREKKSDRIGSQIDWITDLLLDVLGVPQVGDIRGPR